LYTVPSNFIINAEQYEFNMSIVHLNTIAAFLAVALATLLASGLSDPAMSNRTSRWDLWTIKFCCKDFRVEINQIEVRTIPWQVFFASMKSDTVENEW